MRFLLAALLSHGSFTSSALMFGEVSSRWSLLFGAPPPESLEVVAFKEWTREIGVFSKLGSECTKNMKHHYSANATIFVQLYGQTVIANSGGHALGDFLCDAFQAPVQSAAGVDMVEHCNGIWRGAFTPFPNATNNLPQLPPAILEKNNRNFVIWGHLNADGMFVADQDYTCLGNCNVSYPWPCVA
mmetsp:Transcript_41169/g.68461  ORF Transcript_41169/g.68461 Transcript_41169/m.68461 type:complete len:186 (-) Transcript_41169:309-866(-)